MPDAENLHLFPENAIHDDTARPARGCQAPDQAARVPAGTPTGRTRRRVARPPGSPRLGCPARCGSVSAAGPQGPARQRLRARRRGKLCFGAPGQQPAAHCLVWHEVARLGRGYGLVDRLDKGDRVIVRCGKRGFDHAGSLAQAVADAATCSSAGRAEAKRPGGGSDDATLRGRWHSSPGPHW